jgi:hypothetical protein
MNTRKGCYINSVKYRFYYGRSNAGNVAYNTQKSREIRYVGEEKDLPYYQINAVTNIILRPRHKYQAQIRKNTNVYPQHKTTECIHTSNHMILTTTGSNAV